MLKSVVLYETESRKIPFSLWISKLKDSKIRALIQSRIDRLATGHYGDFKHLQDAVCELRLDYGPGYRLYFAELENKRVVLLLLGGAKSTQSKDIKKALGYWKSFKERYDYGH